MCNKLILGLFPLSLIMVLALAMASCGVAEVSAPAPGPGSVKTTLSSNIEPPWKVDWDKTVAAAKQEGVVSLYSGAGPGQLEAIRKGFADAYGINIESVTGRGNEVSEKLFRERKAGLYLADVGSLGATTLVSDMKPQGVLDPLKPQLVLPEVLDFKLWYGGSHIYCDNDGAYALSWAYSPATGAVINTDTVKPGEITSNKSLLHPKWKGKIVLNDPTVSGTGQSWFQMTSRAVGYEFMREFAKQEPAITRDLRLLLEWVARGKYAVAVGPNSNTIGEFLNAGAPLKQVLLSDAPYAITAYPLALFNKAPHPNAARVFINWFLTKEAQTIASKAFMSQSARLDVPTDHLDPDAVRQPGLIYLFSNAEDVTSERRQSGIEAQKIFGLGAK
ncbi:MAG: extracellular solute-binding protein [Chloroflexi bacterium]|nr:extracellular solute-binding protein [Chloroflexota bacterium]